MLQFGRRQESTCEPTELGPRLKDIAGLLQRQAKVRNVSLELDLDESLPRVLIDPLELEQVLVNLITNAFQAMPQGGRVTITAGRAGDGVDLEVVDTGQGMPPEVRERLFEPFFTTKPPGQGTGLGLAVCYGLVRSWGGRLEVESEPGQGTVMRLCLPPGGAV
jgi:two-component system NtrC family sensor kinase